MIISQLLKISHESGVPIQTTLDKFPSAKQVAKTLGIEITMEPSPGQEMAG